MLSLFGSSAGSIRRVPGFDLHRSTALREPKIRIKLAAVDKHFLNAFTVNLTYALNIKIVIRFSYVHPSFFLNFSYATLDRGHEKKS